MISAAYSVQLKAEVKSPYETVIEKWQLFSLFVLVITL